MKKIVIAITGASGVNLGLKLAKAVPNDYKKFLIISDSAKKVFKKEENLNIDNGIFLDNKDISAPPSSGSFVVEKMAIVPCSMNTLAKISYGLADNLITRVASVMIKEKRELLLAPREMPFSSIAIENMLKLSNLGVIISPPVLGYYSNQTSLEEMENFIIGKWLDSLRIDNNLYKRWNG